MELDILTYNNNNNININNGLKPTKIAKLENDSKIVFSNVGCYQHDDYNDAHMLSFSSSSSSKLESIVNVSNASWQNGSHCYTCSGGNMSASMYVMNGAKAAFTPSQWVELEEQAMIYKYIIANEPIPHNLLISITRAFESACFSSYNGGFFRPNSFGWGPFYDPESGRCRRTDGKKWRCSRDAVPDQKYCERHMNRGRHRSRKPVEGQDGHFTSRTNSSKTSSTTSLVNMTSPSSALVGPGGGGSSNSFAYTLNQNKDSHHVTRFDFLSPDISLNSIGNTFSINKEHHLYAESVDADALESNPHKSTFLCQTRSENSTRVSISIPVPFPADFMSSTSSPTGGRIIPVSPSRLSHVGLMEGSEKQSNWVPISWETSMGGPLGEVLKTSSNGLTSAQ